MADHCDFKALMSTRGLRRTRVRESLLEVLADRSGAMSAPEILEVLMDSGRVNKVTVYRILEDFTRCGILRRVPAEGRAARYELACEHHPPHPHFQCHACGTVQCLEAIPLERVWSAIKGPRGNRAERMEIRVGGLCRKCCQEGQKNDLGEGARE
jgi:Fur family ferric uptake transcriptional regulator